MIFGHLDCLDSYSHLLGDAVWRDVFSWLRNFDPGIQAGLHVLDKAMLTANVHGYETRTRSNCRFESHRKFIDLQFCIRGGELIAWCKTPDLRPAGSFNEEKDLQFYEAAPSQTVLQMLPSYFAIFYPSDAHMPKLEDGIHPDVFKLVIKVPVEAVDKPEHDFQDKETANYLPARV